VFTFKHPKLKPKLKIGSNGFLIWVSWHQGKYTINQDGYGFKWQNINKFLILISYV